MQRNFTNDDFEDFLKRSADGLRMPPSDQVWDGIERDLKKRRRRIGYFTSAFLLLSGCIGYLLVNNTKDIPVSKVAVATSERDDIAKEHASAYPSHGLPSMQKAKIIDFNERIKQQQLSASANKESLQTSNRSNKSLASLLLRKNAEPSVSDNNGSASDNSNKITGDNNETAVANEPFTPTIIDSDIQETATNALNTQQEVKVDHTDKLLSIESVTNIFRFTRSKARKFALQFFFTPNISYRKLSENKSYLRSLPPSSIGISPMNRNLDVNNAVTHKPDIGIELGMIAKYKIAKSINLRGGLQFNINRYDIKAFAAPSEVATMALTSGANQVDFVGASTNYRNFNGFKTNWLQNFYFQVSAPVGLEFKLFSNKNTHFGLATTLQPTYVLSERAYMISTDYKNYAEAPFLGRRWNVNTALETYVSYSTGRMQWQVGPQVRYQLLSSYISKYPVKENLFDFGLRVGISINKKESGGSSQ